MVAVDLGDRSAMAAGDVVGEDLQFRLGRELAVVGEQRVCFWRLSARSEPDFRLQEAQKPHHKAAGKST